MASEREEDADIDIRRLKMLEYKQKYLCATISTPPENNFSFRRNSSKHAIICGSISQSPHIYRKLRSTRKKFSRVRCSTNPSAALKTSFFSILLRNLKPSSDISKAYLSLIHFSSFLFFFFFFAFSSLPFTCSRSFYFLIASYVHVVYEATQYKSYITELGT